ncbi:MAG: acyl-CoA dehydrogenase family protein [Candidatus Pristimantibacillus lignocellulolyticus]|uniref:Acyl-CoA dehydrogenase family protein n=1 Tax=Candidatus Pristimantibacillus lignocellulolyticus TaxID=2994561 RepID=A0A9J6ZK40_9BACL|nr:MAG: acyl-CoA dehydrogenase family protein [Candidatus Pristimantibacillus lignocellulolyticus]
MSTTKATSFGGRFVIENSDPMLTTIPEDFTSEQRMMSEAAQQYMDAEITPNDVEIEALNYELTVQLMRIAGEQGLLGADIPEQYGGLGLDKVSTTLLAETLAKSSSFALSVGAHTGIGTLPIVFFGTTAQKEKYLPLLATGEKIAAYCLTEPASGSDALGAKTNAKLSEDGKHYVLNGSKIFITNAGFADVFIVYAKIDNEHFTAFIVEREMEGFSIGPEEHKMGIKGSSTCPLYFEDVHVPVENVLGEIGKGHLIAFNILNIGRFKLGAACLGTAKEAIQLAASYANVRKQFNQPISSYPLIGAKLADMNIATFVTESMVYRIAGWMDAMLSEIDQTSSHVATDSGKLAAKAIGEYAMEYSMIKVFASEALDFVSDEAVQIHGGYGFIKEYKVERIYRDSRINRIFEGTNEINRLLIPGTLIKKAMKNELPLLDKIQELQAQLLEPQTPPQLEGNLSLEGHRIEQAKKLFLMIGGIAVQRYGVKLEREQEILESLANMMILTFAMESAYLRAQKRISLGLDNDESSTVAMMTQVYVQEAMDQIEGIAKKALVRMESGDALRMQLSIVKKLTKASLTDVITLKRKIAAKVIVSEQYIV